MSDKLKPHTNQTDIVEALLGGKDASSAQCLSTAHAHTVEQWEEVIFVAQSDFRDTEQTIVDSVMAQIEGGLEYKEASSNGRYFTLGRVVAIAATTLLVAGLFVATHVGPAMVETSHIVAQEDLLTESVEVTNGTVVTNSSFPVTSISSKGSVLLSNQDSVESVFMTSALRLEAVNGTLRIDSL